MPSTRPPAQEQELLAAVIRQTPFFVGVSDAELKPVFVNEAGRRMVGLGPDGDISAIPIAQFFHPEDQAIVRDVALPALLRDGAWEGELRFRHFAGGPDIEVRWRAFALYGPDGAVIGAATITADISERKRAEAKLRDSEARLQAAIDLVGLSPYTWDPATGALEWDDRLKAMWGLPADACVDSGVWMAGIHPEDRPRVEAAVAGCVHPDGDGAYQIEYRVIGIEDGVERWVSTQGRTIFQDKQPVGFIGVALDITSRRRAEQDLRESEERFRQFADNSRDVLWMLDVATNALTYVSPAFEQVWGGALEAVLPDMAGWTRTIHPDDRDKALATFQRVLDGAVVTQEYRIVRPDGSVRWIRDTGFPILGAPGRIGGIAQDITQHEGSLVYTVDGDADAHATLTQILQRGGFEVKAFATPKDFLEVASVLLPGCVVVDTRSHAGSLAVAKELKARGIGLPVVVVSDCAGDMTLAVQAMKAGAVDVLDGSCAPDLLLAAVSTALADIRAIVERDRGAELAKTRVAGLSAREREVLDRLLAGGTNKTIARELGISPRTVEAHRAHVMERLGAQTLPEAVLMAAAAGVQASRSPGDPDDPKGLAGA